MLPGALVGFPPEVPLHPEVSFVVIAYNEARTIGQALTAIAAQRHHCHREIVVVDDGSEDDTAAVVRAFAGEHDDVRLLSLPQNLGRGAARAAGLEAAQSELIAFVDSDIVLPPDWLGRCLQEIGDRDAVGGVAVPDGDVGYVYRQFALEPKVVSATTTVTGNNGLYRRGVFTHGGFDPGLRDGEDVALNHVLHTHGARLLTITDLHVRHEEHKSFSQSLRWLYQSGLGAARQLYRYREVRVPDLVFAGWLASIVVALTPGRHSNTRKAAPALYLLATAGGHTARAFVLRGAGPKRVAGAVLVDTAMLGAYFAGRLHGSLKIADLVRSEQPDHGRRGT